MPRRLLTALLLVVVAGIVVAGLFVVLTREDEDDPSDVVAGAADATLDAGTARFTARSEASPQGLPIEATGDGIVDFEGDRSEVVLRLPRSISANTMQAVVEGTTVYLQLDNALARRLGVTTPWASIDQAALRGTPAAAMVSLWPGTGRAEVVNIVELLRTAEDGEEVGEEPIGDVATTHYRTTAARAAAEARIDEAQDPEGFAEFLQSFAADEIEVDVWIDEEGLIRRTAFVLGRNPAVTISMDLSEFGTELTVERPPPEQVTDVTSQIAALAGPSG